MRWKDKEGLRDAVEEKSRYWFPAAVAWHRAFFAQFSTFHICRRGWDHRDASINGN